MLEAARVHRLYGRHGAGLEARFVGDDLFDQLSRALPKGRKYDNKGGDTDIVAALKIDPSLPETVAKLGIELGICRHHVLRHHGLAVHLRRLHRPLKHRAPPRAPARPLDRHGQSGARINLDGLDLRPGLGDGRRLVQSPHRCQPGRYRARALARMADQRQPSRPESGAASLPGRPRHSGNAQAGGRPAQSPRTIWRRDSGAAQQPAGYYARGELRESQQDLTGALADYARAAEVAPNATLGWQGRCRVELEQSQLEAALADCDQALILQPGLFVARDLRGWVKLKQGNAPAAIAEFTAVLASRPTYAASLYGRGLARQRNGDADGAADLAAARKLDPEIKTRVARYGF